MKEPRATRFSQSIIFKSLLLLILSTILIASISIFFFAKGQIKALTNWSSDNNRTQLRQMVFAANNEIRLFANRIIFLTPKGKQFNKTAKALSEGRVPRGAVQAAAVRILSTVAWCLANQR